MAPRTLSEKLWDAHVVHSAEGEPDLLFIDLHLIHEVTSPQAFDGLRLAGRKVRRPDLTVATADHNVPTTDIDKPVADPVSAQQLKVLNDNAAEFGITCYPMGNANQGIVHIIGPEQGWTQPGMTIVCGDSHTSTHGAFGALAFGIGTSEVEHVLATQTLPQVRPKTMAVTVEGELPPGVSAKDVALTVIGTIGTGGGMGHVIEYRGSAIRSLSMEGRMTLCNMSIEGGARAGLVAPDETTFEYVKGRDHAPTGPAWEDAEAYWRTLPTDEGARFDKEVVIDAATITPYVTWGTNPAQVTAITGSVPDPEAMSDAGDREAAERALAYMGLTAGTPMRAVAVDTVFLGSCTNSRIEDFRVAADVLRGRTVRAGLRALAVPGSHRVKAQAEAEGLDEVFKAAGFEWASPAVPVPGHEPRTSSPSASGAASTSNRNFEGRQGRGGRNRASRLPCGRGSGHGGRDTSPPRGTSPDDKTNDDKKQEARRHATTAAPCHSTARTSTPTKSSRPTGSSGSSGTGSFGAGLFSRWRDDRDFVLNNPSSSGPPSWWPGPTSAPVRPASTRCGPCRTTGSPPSSRRASPTSFAITARSRGCCRSRSPRSSTGNCWAPVEKDPTLEITIAVARGTIEAPAAGLAGTFPLDEFTRQCLLNGWDDSGLLAALRGGHHRLRTSATPPSSRRPSPAMVTFRPMTEDDVPAAVAAFRQRPSRHAGPRHSPPAT